MKKLRIDNKKLVEIITSKDFIDRAETAIKATEITGKECYFEIYTIPTIEGPKIVYDKLYLGSSTNSSYIDLRKEILKELKEKVKNKKNKIILKCEPLNNSEIIIDEYIGFKKIPDIIINTNTNIIKSRKINKKQLEDIVSSGYIILDPHYKLIKNLPKRRLKYFYEKPKVKIKIEKKEFNIPFSDSFFSYDFAYFHTHPSNCGSFSKGDLRSMSSTFPCIHFLGFKSKNRYYMIIGQGKNEDLLKKINVGYYRYFKKQHCILPPIPLSHLKETSFPIDFPRLFRHFYVEYSISHPLRELKNEFLPEYGLCHIPNAQILDEILKCSERVRNKFYKHIKTCIRCYTEFLDKSSINS